MDDPGMLHFRVFDNQSNPKGLVKWLYMYMYTATRKHDSHDSSRLSTHTEPPRPIYLLFTILYAIDFNRDQEHINAI